MRIGLDLDNTIIRYEDVFAEESKKLGLVSEDWSGTKKELREYLRSLPNGERKWQEIQGRVYGPCMQKADLFPGVASFLIRCRVKGYQINIWNTQYRT